MRKKIIYFLVSFGVVFLTTLTAKNIFSQQADVSGTTLLLDSSSHTVANGQNFTVGLGITNPDKPVAGIDVVIRYDSSYLDVVDILGGGTTLKTIVPITGNSFDMASAIKINTANPSLSRIEYGLLSFDLSQNEVTATLTSSYDPLTNPISAISFHPKKEGNTTLEILYEGSGKTTDSNIVTILNGEISDIMSTPSGKLDISISSSPSITPRPSISVSATPSPTPSPLPSNECVLYDFDSDLKITVSDIMQVAARWNQKTGDAKYDVKYDFNGDGVISVVDIQKIASKWGVVCTAN